MLRNCVKLFQNFYPLYCTDIRGTCFIFYHWNRLYTSKLYVFLCKLLGECHYINSMSVIFCLLLFIQFCIPLMYCFVLFYVFCFRYPWKRIKFEWSVMLHSLKHHPFDTMTNIIRTLRYIFRKLLVNYYRAGFQLHWCDNIKTLMDNDAE